MPLLLVYPGSLCSPLPVTGALPVSNFLSKSRVSIFARQRFHDGKGVDDFSSLFIFNVGLFCAVSRTLRATKTSSWITGHHVLYSPFPELSREKSGVKVQVVYSKGLREARLSLRWHKRIKHLQRVNRRVVRGSLHVATHCLALFAPRELTEGDSYRGGVAATRNKNS